MRVAYEGFIYSHASVMYNALNEIPQIVKLVQVGIRDFSHGELEYASENSSRIISFFDRDIKERMYEGETWKQIVDIIVFSLPDHIYISFDVDGLDPKLCPNTGTPVQSGLEIEQVYYMFKAILKSGKKIIGFDLNETGISETDWDANVSARILFKLCNLLIASNS